MLGMLGTLLGYWYGCPWLLQQTKVVTPLNIVQRTRNMFVGAECWACWAFLAFFDVQPVLDMFQVSSPGPPQNLTQHASQVHARNEFCMLNTGETKRLVPGIHFD